MPGRNKVVYSKDLGYSYVLDPNGKQIGGLEGDHSNNIMALDPDLASQMQMDRPFTPTTIPNKIAQMGKDFVVNAAAQAPLSFIPGAGPMATILRLGSSLGAGYGMDSLINPNKSVEEKRANALLNTTIGEALPWLVSKGQNFRLPGKTTVGTSTSVSDPTIMESTSNRAGSSVSRGTSASEGTSTSNGSSLSEGATTSSGNTKGITNSSASGRGTTNSSGTGNTSGDFQSTTIRQPYTGEITPEMQDIHNAIERLKVRLEGAKTQSQSTQIQNVIEKYQAALGEHQDMQAGTISKTTGSRVGESSNSSTSNNEHNSGSTSQSSSANTNESRSLSNSESTSKGNTTSNSNSSSQNTNTGTTNTSGTIQPGQKTTQHTTETRGNNFFERLMDGILDAHKTTTNQLSKLKDFGIGMGATDIKSLLDDLNRK